MLPLRADRTGMAVPAQQKEGRLPREPPLFFRLRQTSYICGPAWVESKSSPSLEVLIEVLDEHPGELVGGCVERLLVRPGVSQNKDGTVALQGKNPLVTFPSGQNSLSH